MRFYVHGEPATQGSMTAVYNRRLACASVRHSNAPALGMWRTDIAHAAREAGGTVVEGPVAITIVFGMRAPQDTRHGYPKKGDLDKLVRAVLDALTGVLYVNDNQVVSLSAAKVWQPYTEIEVLAVERRSPSNQATLWQENAYRVEADKA